MMNFTKINAAMSAQPSNHEKSRVLRDWLAEQAANQTELTVRELANLAARMDARLCLHNHPYYSIPGRDGGSPDGIVVGAPSHDWVTDGTYVSIFYPHVRGRAGTPCRECL